MGGREWSYGFLPGDQSFASRPFVEANHKPSLRQSPSSMFVPGLNESMRRPATPDGTESVLEFDVLSHSMSVVGASSYVTDIFFL